jgi:hypothetical protein
VKKNALDTADKAPDLVMHYRPLRLKAVVAATTIKACSSAETKQVGRGAPLRESGCE